MRSVIAFLIGLVLVLCLSTGALGDVPPPVKHVTVTVDTVMNDTRTQVNIFVNGVNIDDRIDELQSEYQMLYDEMIKGKMGISDYMMLSKIRNELINLYNTKIASAMQSGNVSEVRKIADMESRLLEMHDDVVTKLAYDISQQENNKYVDRGWFDIYGNHRDFGDAEYLVNDEFEFRLDDCKSEIGRSAVLQGGTIKIYGTISLYNWGTTKHLKVILADPDSRVKPQTIISTELGEDASSEFARIHWIYPTQFVIEINTTEMVPGLKRIDVKFDGYVVSCVFEVIRPYINTEKVGQFVKIYTNYPELQVKSGNTTKVVIPIDGVAWVKAPAEIDGIIS